MSEKEMPPDAAILTHVPRQFFATIGLVGWVFSLCIPQIQAAPPPFPDMEHSWFGYQEAVAYLRIRGVLEGYPDGTFRPQQNVNRAELLKIVLKGKGGATPVVAQPCFSDIDPRAWYAPFVCAAARRNIVEGYPDGTFKPEQTVNFAEAIKIVLRAYDRDIEEHRGQQWYEPYVQELDHNDVLPRHSFIPWEGLTRERAADLIDRVLRYEEGKITLRHSRGCGTPSSPMPGSLTVKGQERSFLFTIPEDYKAQEPSPLIIAFHGRTNSNAMVRSYYGLDRSSEEFFIAYPAALQRNDGTFSWSDPGDTPNTLRDIAFFDALIETITTRYCIDMHRIFVVGHSLGAWIANSIACVRGGVVRASATVGGDSVFTSCAGPSAALIIHNPHDEQASFAGAERLRTMRVTENVCSTATQETDPSSLKCVLHEGCVNGNDVVFCPHEQDFDERGRYYPHNWPRETGKVIAMFLRSFR